MSASTASLRDLLDFVERQFDFVLDDESEAGDCLLRWVVVLRRLETEPRLTNILSREGEAQLEAYNLHLAALRQELLGLWKRDMQILKAAGEHPQFSAAPFGPVARYEERLGARQPVSMPNSPRENKDTGDALDDTSVLEFWASHAKGATGQTDANKQKLEKLERTLRELRVRHTLALREFHTAVRATAAPALHRLRDLAQRTNPPPAHDLLEAARRLSAEKLAKAVHTPQEADDRDTLLLQAKAALIRDTRTLRADLRARIGLTGSRLGLLDRFVAKSQTYDAARIRQLVDEERALKEQSGGKLAIEAILTVELARFLFEQGLNPLVDPKLAGLRPDVFEQSSADYTLYVEAKQYSTKSPRAMIIKAVRQVFETWNRLRAQFPVTEAFLVIFRVDGPLVIVDETLRGSFGDLHIRVADVAASAGSTSKGGPIHIAAEALLGSSSTGDEEG